MNKNPTLLGAMRRELLAATFLTTLGTNLSGPVHAQTAPREAGGTVALPTIDVEGTGAGPGGRFTGYSVPNATTATKTDAPILQTPVSIQVVPRQTMDDQQATTLGEALRNVPGVMVGR